MQFTPHNYQSYCIQRVVEDPAVGLFLRPEKFEVLKLGMTDVVPYTIENGISPIGILLVVW